MACDPNTEIGCGFTIGQKIEPVKYFGSVINTSTNQKIGNITTEPSVFNFNTINADDNLKLSQANYMDTMSNFYNTKLADMNSWQHQYLQPATQIIGALGTLSGMYLGFKQLGMAREQLGIAKEQWNRAKQEADRIAKVREGIVKAYTS